METEYQTTQSVYLQFSRAQWCTLKRDTPLPLTAEEAQQLRGQIDVVSLQEIDEIYLPLSRLLSLYVTARQGLYRASAEFLGNQEPKVPFIIGVSGSVAVGKSTTSRVLQALLSRWPNHPKVSIITTDGFLYPNAELEKRGIMHRKGFPESFNVGKLLGVLKAIKSGQRNVEVPIYSHHAYDIIPGEHAIIDNPDIVILEGLNILQVGKEQPSLDRPLLFVSDLFDFSLFVDAEVALIRQWYVERVLSFWEGPFQQQDSYFHYLKDLSRDEVRQFAERVWQDINELNLLENILPYRQRAELILQKGTDHQIHSVWLRKL